MGHQVKMSTNSRTLNSKLSYEELAQHLLNRRKARSDIVTYAGVIDVPGRPVSDDPDCELFEPVETNLASHHELILRGLDETSKTPYGRIMFLMPPGSAKSTYGSVVFPSKYLGEQGGRKLILGSYGADLARKMGRRTRSIIRQQRYQRILNTTLSPDSSAADQFSLSNGSEYMATGLLAGVTGNRAHGVILDDPLSGREAANSQAIRNKTWEAYQDDLLTRLIPGGWLAMILTHWHQEDPAGRILPEDWKGESGLFECRDGMTWRVVCLQARCETQSDPLGRKIGEYLWPEWFTPKHWAQFECEPQTWASLFQQIPSPLEGALFKPDQIQVIDAPPAGVTWVRGWDLAATHEGGDYTAGVKMGKLNDRIVIADVARLRGSPDEVERTLVATSSGDGNGCEVHIPQDPGQAGKSQVQYFTSKLLGYRVKSSPETGDKVTRASPLAAQVNVGNVSMVRGSWNRAFIEELRMFPNGSNDDQVDAASRAFAAITSAKRSFFG